MIFIYYAIIFLSSILLADIQVVALFDNAGLNVYIIDIFYGIFIFTFIRYLINNSYSKISSAGNIFVLFLLSIVFFIVVGYFNFGYRAIGEGRHFFWLFAFFLPFYIYPLDKTIEVKEILDTIEKTIYLSAILAIVLFFIEIFNGGRVFLAQQNFEFVGFSDFRGTRYLGSEETYNIVVLILFLGIKTIISKKAKLTDLILIIILTSIVIITRNRTAPIALLLAFLLYLVLNGRIKQIVTITLIIIFSLSLISLLVPQLQKSIILAFGGVFDIQDDSTGNWRFLIQSAAVQDGLENPLFGKGFGGYFQYYIPELEQIVELPPHSAFVHLFSKTGIIIVILAFWAIIKVAIASFQLSLKNNNNNQLATFYVLIFIVTVSQIPYGFAYGFSIYFGLFVGFFVNLAYREDCI
jgi:hypothetical protein